VIGTRPPLGLLVFENGATYTVDADYLIGRNPQIDERVGSGELRSIMLEDLTGAVSRVHAEVRLDGWDVTVADSGSSNGTFVAPAGQDWAELVPGEAHRLVPGTRVRLGDAVFSFESPSGVR
jgi:pSer/pThr/pTyr-binding forkhead associated (FHA) protein